MSDSLRTDVLEISYEVTGPADGYPLLLLHGWPDAARGWTPIARHLNAHGFRTVTPDLRGSGATRFLAAASPRDGHAAALVQDALDLADGLGLARFGVIGHDWGGRAAYSLAAVAPGRVTAIASLALAYQPHGVFSMPGFGQARAFWYQWLLYVDAGVEAVTRDPIGFARAQWDTWSPPGWFDDAEFATTATAFTNPDWVPVTLSAYRSRFLADEPLDPRYDALRARLSGTGALPVKTLVIQGGADYCDEPASSEGLEKWFTGGYRREVLDGVGHFPHREAPDRVAGLLTEHFR